MSGHQRKAFTLIELLVVVAIIALLISILLPSLKRAKDQAKAAVCGSNVRQMGIAMEFYLEDNNDFYPGEHSTKGGSAGQSYITWAPRLRQYASMNEKLFWCPAADDDTYWQVKFGVRNPQRWMQGYGYQWDEKPLRASDHGDLFCYGYNSWGVSEGCTNQYGTSLGLGAEVDNPFNPGAWAVRREYVKVPAEMIAIADSQADGNWDSAIDPEEWQQHEWPSSRHFGGSEVLFCDGHVIFQEQLKLVEPVEWTRRFWNNDNLPHRECWE